MQQRSEKQKRIGKKFKLSSSFKCVNKAMIMSRIYSKQEINDDNFNFSNPF